MSVASDLAAFSSGVDIADVPTHVVDRIECMLLDALAISHFVAARTPWGKAVHAYASDLTAGNGGCQLVGGSLRALPTTAALVNGTLSMGFEYEDMHDRGDGHPFSIVAPAALAAAEHRGASGADLLSALIAGYEVGVRISYALDKREDPWPERGLYPITIFGVFGAAAGAARALGLDARATTNALGIAGSHAFGTMQAHKEGTMTRRLHAGKAAEIGVTAALLAAQGFTGPNEIVEGEFGVYPTFAEGTSRFEEITADVGTSWSTDGAWLKNYACNGLFQAPLDALLDLFERHALESAQIESVRVSIAKATRLHGRPSSVTPVNAQFSLHFCMALAMVRGRPRPEMFLDDSIGDPAVTAAMDKIEVELAEDLRMRHPQSSRPGRVDLLLVDGTRLTEEVIYPKGHPRHPMDWSDVRRKCEELLAGVATGAGSVGNLEATVRGLRRSDAVPTFAV